jgi:hypothetical protein
MSGDRLAEISANTYVKPYSRPELDGAVGLTSREVAAAIGAQHQHVNEKIRRNRRLLAAQGFRIVDSVVNATGARAFTFVVDVATAKYLAATWKNFAGLSYFRYLLECERVNETVVPRLVDEVARLRADVAALTAPKVRRLPGRSIVAFIKKVITERDMFGDEQRRVVTERKAYAALTDEERRRYKTEHRARVMRGLADAQERDITYADIPRLLN